MIGILCAAALLRMDSLDSQCLWFDEIWHAELSTGRGSAHLRLAPNQWLESVPDLVSLRDAPPAWEIWRHMDLVLHPPLYHTVLRGWREVMGDSVRSWRGLSVLFSVAAVGLIGVLGIESFGWRGAILAAGLAAVGATQIAQARDTRGYTLALVLAIVAAMATLRSARAERASLSIVIVGVASVALLFTHYFTAGVLAGCGVYVLLAVRGRRRWGMIAALGGAVAVFVAAWGPTLREQLACVPETADLFLKEPADGHALRTMVRAVQLPAVLLVDPVARGEGAWPVGLFLAGLGLWVGLILLARHDPQARLWLSMLACTTLLLAGLDLARGTRHLVFTRYALAVSPAVCIACAGLLPRGDRWRWNFGSVAAVGIVGLAVLTSPWGRVATVDYRPLGESLHEQSAPDEPIILCSPNPAGRDGQTLYLYLAYYGGLFPRDLFIATRSLDPQAIEARRGRTAWIVSANPDIDPSKVVPGCTLVAAREFSTVGGAGACFKVRLPEQANLSAGSE